MDAPGTENSETVPKNWLWVKAGLLSFWSRTTISMVVGFSSLSPLGDSAKAFSYTHTQTNTQTVTTETWFLIKSAFTRLLLLTVKYCNPHAFNEGNRPTKVAFGIRGICAKHMLEMAERYVQDVRFNIIGYITGIWPETFWILSQDGHKHPWKLTFGCLH